MSDNPIQVAVLDMAGTTVADDGLVVRAFEAAASAAGLPAEGPEREQARRYVLDTMGQSKIVVFRALFGTEERAQRANAEFERAYAELIDNGHATPIDGAADAITDLRAAGIKVALTTGFSGTTQDKLLAALGWQHLADLALAPGGGIRSRPYPDLVLTALMRLDADGVGNVAVLGDTSTDVDSALRAGAAIAAGTLTGAHSEEELRAAGATHVVGSVVDFADLLLATHQSEDQ
ncbi:hydrolase [Mycolicibacterium canariasense]|uniref:Hydrolase n=1 Tax=Mycolicibacterium canariasense TaxID=228230 RepID=A0A100WKB6_MYCCR|nr:phosphonatase-like hydrolase [Mycolicibacterium canariasense]MCV7207581.1 phosphonatase-like hydrolase [Mycolicibacterium canariasense]ORV08809.1 haloacid dehalogenase [Mycolicibacterium canariasense]GAS99691.1 hydrolase [Mycolicibacterium canariasense]